LSRKAPDLGVECLDPLRRLDRCVGVGDDLVDGGLLDLHDRRAGVGQGVVLAVERGRQVEQELQAVAVVLVGQHQRKNLRRDRADLHRPVGHRRNRLVGAIKLERRCTDPAFDRRRHAGLDHLPDQVAGTLVGHEVRRRHLDARLADAGDALGGVAHPAAAGDVVVEPGIAVDENVDAGPVLGRDVAGEAIEVLLAVGRLREPVGQRQAAQVGGVPARPRQRPGRGGEQGLALGRGEHVAPSSRSDHRRRVELLACRS
jgi:hypothetical protein